MSVKIIIVLLIGIITGKVLSFNSIEFIVMDNFIQYILIFLVFFVGIDVGNSKETLKDGLTLGTIVIKLPFFTAIGSIIGAIIGSLIVNYNLLECIAVGSGFGWYSFSSVVISANYSVKLGAVAFMSNLFRELISFLIIPILMEKNKKYEAISISGAPSMDTLLGIIVNSGGKDLVFISIVNGFILSVLVTLIVPLVLSFM